MIADSRILQPWRRVNRLALLGMFGLLFGVAAAQEPQQKPTVTKAATETHVIRLKFAQAEEIAKVIAEVFAASPQGSVPLSIGIDERVNALVVQTSKEKFAEIQAIIEKLDFSTKPLLAGTEPRSLIPELKLFQLKRIEVDQALEDALRLIIGADKINRLILDRGRKQILVYADVNTLDALAAFLAKISDSVSDRPIQDVQVRIVWLVDGLARESDSLLSDDLKEVLPGLAKLGIAKPRLAAQTLVNVTPNSEFSVQGVAKLDTNCRFSVTGHYNDKKDTPGLAISIRASRDREHGPEEICNVQTEISAPPGHLVVLGMMPTEGMTSVFVVQVLRPDAKKPAGQK